MMYEDYNGLISYQSNRDYSGYPETGDPLKRITEYMIRKYIWDTFT